MCWRTKYVMNLILNKVKFQIIKTNSFIHYVDEKNVIISKKNILFKSLDSGNTWEKWLEIPIDFISKLQIQNKLSRRLFRQYIYHVIPGEKDVVVFGFRQIYVFDVKTKKLVSRNPIVGSRPLVVTEFKNDVYYGEYTSNPNRDPIRLFKSSLDKTKFEAFYIFKNIRHIHGVQHDPYSDRLFVTTGDEDDECIIGYFEDKAFLPLVQGSQQARGIQLLFSKDYIFYATDAPHEKNYIYKIDRKTKEIRKVQEIGGPVFYGTQLGNLLFFSTVCEPSKVNNQKEVELWFSADGTDWRCIQTFKKDKYHMKLFQYGQLIFPRGPGHGMNLWVSAFATEMDQKVLKLTLPESNLNIEV